MTLLRSNIPKGKYRVVGVDLFDHGDYVVGDYNTKDEAFTIASSHNTKRRGSMDDIYYAYNDRGEYLHSPLGETGVSP